MRNGSILLRTLLLSTSQRNIYRHTGDKKKRKRIIAGYVGAVCLYAMLMGYSISMCVGYGTYGLIDATPVMCALVISAFSFLFTFFKTNGYLFQFREYDMLMSLPFEARTVAACKFLYMYMKSLPWYLSVALAMMIGYGYYARPQVYVYPLWMILSLFLPIIPMLAAAFLGFLIARISAGFRKTNIIQTILTMAFIIFCFSIRYIIEAFFKDDRVEATLEAVAGATGQAADMYLPAGWFAKAVINGSIIAILLLVLASALLFTIVFRIVGNSYRNINSMLKSHAASGKYRLTGQKKKSVILAIAWKEWRRMAGSTTYMTNVGIGVILAFLLGVITLILGFDRIVGIVTQNAPIDSSILRPAIPFICYFFIGMLSTTACSPSLEGKNYWILQSLPVEKKTIYQGKMLFNMLLTVPFMIFSALCLCLSSGTPALETVMYLVLGVTLCAFSTSWGCVCGIRHMRLDWENEIEVIKQGTAVTIYLLPNMFAVMGLAVLAVVLGMRMSHVLMTGIMILIAAALSVFSYLGVCNLTGRDIDSCGGKQSSVV
ncbi:MAG: hypothetical protein K5696_02180 [Lachnospiraceae bacterium]|nr:hypothetical protein [Lachnospiraceae bacterium]